MDDSEATTPLHFLPAHPAYRRELEARMKRFVQLLKLVSKSRGATVGHPRPHFVEEPLADVFDRDGSLVRFCYRLVDYVDPAELKLENNTKVLCEIEHREQRLLWMSDESNKSSVGVVFFTKLSAPEEERLVQEFAVARKKQCQWEGCRDIATRRFMVVVELENGERKQYGTKCFAHVFNVDWKQYKPLLGERCAPSSADCSAEAVIRAVESKLPSEPAGSSMMTVDVESMSVEQQQSVGGSASVASPQPIYQLSLADVIRQYCTECVRSSLRCRGCLAYPSSFSTSNHQQINEMTSRLYDLVMTPCPVVPGSFRMHSKIVSMWQSVKLATCHTRSVISSLPDTSTIKFALDSLATMDSSFLTMSKASKIRTLCDACQSARSQRPSPSPGLGVPTQQWSMTISNGLLSAAPTPLPVGVRTVPLSFDSEHRDRNLDGDVLIQFESPQETLLLSIRRDVYQQYRSVLRVGSTIHLSVWRSPDGSVSRVSIPF